jgi:hypothetical protein
MQRVMCLSIGVLFMATSLMAQGQGAAPAQGGARQGGAPPAPQGLAAGMQADYNRAKNLVLGSLNEMPEEGFAHAPAEGIRTFANIFAHIADQNYNFCSQAAGVPSPRMGQPGLEMGGTIKTKADALKVIQEMYAFCDPIFASLTDASMAEQVMTGRGSRARGAILVGVVAHDNEMYGISTVYLRTNGRVPPASQGRGRGGRQGGGQAAPPAGGRGQ